MLIVLSFGHPLNTGSTVPSQFFALKLTLSRSSQSENAPKAKLVICSPIVTLFNFVPLKALYSIDLTEVGIEIVSIGVYANKLQPITVTFGPITIVLSFGHPLNTGLYELSQFIALKLTLSRFSQSENALNDIFVSFSGIVTVFNDVPIKAL